MSDQERRRLARVSLRVPVHVEGHDPDGKAWTEMTKSHDASVQGVAFDLRHPVSKGALLNLSLPLPQRLRRHDPVSPSYRVYALVRDIQSEGDAARVGVVFLGQKPPKGHDKNPGMLYLLPGDRQSATAGRPERRSSRRLDIQLDVRVRRIEVEQEERTVTENISVRGLRAPTTLPVARGEIVEVEEVWGPFKTRAEIRNVYIGKDNVPRLNVRFLDADAPTRLLPDAV